MGTSLMSYVMTLEHYIKDADKLLESSYPENRIKAAGCIAGAVVYVQAIRELLEGEYAAKK